jgi:transcriptional regulator with XRE-family HTH domain
LSRKKYLSGHDFMIGDRIKEIRIGKRLSLRKFAAPIGVGFSYIGKLERGDESNPSEPFIASLCAAYNVNRHWLETGKGEPYLQQSSLPDPLLAKLLKLYELLDDNNKQIVTEFAQDRLDLMRLKSKPSIKKSKRGRAHD